MKFGKLIAANKFTLVTSLPSNSLALAQAAIEGGAQAVKVHANVWHRASGHTFGTFAENRTFLKELVQLCGDVPVGLVPGADEAFITNDERVELENMGVDFFSSYAAHLPPYMMDSTKLTKMVAIGHGYTQNTLDGVGRTGIEVLECSIQPGEAYGQKLNLDDIIRYADIAAKVNIPTLIPTQKHIVPEDVRHLYAVGCKAVMIGAIVMGKEPESAVVKSTAAAFAAAIRAL